MVGPFSAAAAIIAKFLHATVIVVDVNDYSLEQVKNNGTDHTLNPDREAP
jgi:threonine dehydrogenase-like Zn-dependent dehydrogenase